MKLADFIGNNASGILFGMGLAGMGAAIIFSHKAGETVDKIRETEGTKEKVGKAAVSYGPVIFSFTLGTVCLGLSRKLKNEALKDALASVVGLSTLYSTQSENFSKYKEAVKETVSKKENEEIEQKYISKVCSDVKEHPFAYIDTGNGDFIFKDYYSGRYFCSSITGIDKAVLNCRKRMVTYGGNEPYITLNDLYDELNIPRLPGLGEEVAWPADYDFDADIGYTTDPANEGIVGMFKMYRDPVSDFRKHLGDFD